VDAIIYFLDNPALRNKRVNKICKGPRFSTGALICGKAGIKEAYATGEVKFLVSRPTQQLSIKKMVKI